MLSGEKEWSDYFEIGIEGLKNIILRDDVLVSIFFLMLFGLFCVPCMFPVSGIYYWLYCPAFLVMMALVINTDPRK